MSRACLFAKEEEQPIKRNCIKDINAANYSGIYLSQTYSQKGGSDCEPSVSALASE